MTITATGADTGTNRFELLVQSITDYAIYMLDPAGVVSSWNAGAQRFKGYTADEIVGEHFSRFYTEEDRATGLPARALATAEREGRFEAEGWRVRNDGKRFWASVVIDPIRAPSGELLGFAKITRDLTERRAVEEDLRKSEERFRLLVQSVTDYAIYMLDVDGTIASWNPGAERFKGYEASEIVGQHFSRFYTEEDRERGTPARALATALEEGRFEAEGWRVRKDGQCFWASVVIDPIRDPSGRHIGFAKITRDLSERREAQKALEQAQESFFQSQKLDAIGKLTGGVAHDFNNLLAVVIGSLDLAQRRMAEGGDITRFIANARTAAERGATLTQRMLAFARKQELKLETVEPAALVRGMADLMQRTLGAGVLVETRFPLKLASVHADAGQLELAVLNLAVNARDAMPEGGTITISARETVLAKHDDLALPAGNYVCLSVLDEGEGMDSDTLKKAMEPFFTTKGIGKGTGLGLSMVHGFAEQSHGKLMLRSAVGKGTTAEIWLPVAAKEKVDAPVAAPTFPRPQAASAERLSVLVVDDDPLVLTNTIAMIEDLGHRVLSAASGREAMEMLSQKPVDLLVTDFAMPLMNGHQLAEAARIGWPSLSVLIVSGYADVPLDHRLAFPRVAKPFTENQLAEGIEAATATRRPEAKLIDFPRR